MKTQDNTIILDIYELEKFFRLPDIRDRLYDKILELQANGVDWNNITVLIPKDFRPIGLKIDIEKRRRKNVLFAAKIEKKM